MTDHELQSWLKHIADTETQFWNYLDYLDNTSALDDTFGWGARLRNMWEKEPHHPCGLLLTGPDGCGKHTAAVHMFRILSDDYYIALISGPALCDGGFDNAKARLLGTIGSYGKENKPLCLILDGLEDCTFRKELFTALGQALTISWLSNVTTPPVFVILIDSQEQDIPAILRSRLRLCRMALPNAARRRAYLENDEFNMIQAGANVNLLVSSTEGLTYAQLADLARNLECAIRILALKGEFSMPDDELTAFLREQLPQPAREDSLRSVADSARQFIEQLPELMQHMGTSVVAAPAAQQNEIGQSSPNSAPAPEPIPNEQDFKKDIIDMPIKDLCTDLFGKVRLEHIKASRANRQRA